MAVRGAYTELEQKMLDDTNRLMDSQVGWDKLTCPMMATKESMSNYAYAVDPKNPLWRDEDYARGTRWGSVIAVPCFAEKFGVDPFPLPVPPELGFPAMILLGEDYEFFQPIRANDTFKVWRRRPLMKDVTSLDGNGPRRLAVMIEDFDLINQKDEIVTRYRHYNQFSFQEGPTRLPYIPEYGYTREELAYADRIEEAEKIRGAEIRYWEDVSVGDALQPVVLGPVSASDMITLDIAHESGSHSIVSRNNSAFRRKEYHHNRASGMGFEQESATGLYYYLGFLHYEDRAARAIGAPRAALFTALSRHLLCRLVSSWMGDDGFIRSYHYRHVSPNFFGEILVAHGRVINKRVADGEHLVDLKVWVENMRGGVTEVATFAVKLVSREVPDKWK